MKKTKLINVIKCHLWHVCQKRWRVDESEWCISKIVKMFSISYISYLFYSLFIVNVANGLYFHIGETERKCFIEEIPDETNVIGKITFFLIFLTTEKNLICSKLQSRTIWSANWRLYAIIFWDRYACWSSRSWW